MSAPMIVGAAGMCCALGWYLDAVVCALRANLDHFRESDFIDQNGEPLRIAALTTQEDHDWGRAHWQQMLESALRDCLQDVKDRADVFDPQRCAIVMLCPDATRPLGNARFFAEIAQDAMEAVGATAYQCDSQMHALPSGRAGLARALQQAQTLLQQGYQRVLLLALDSLLHAAQIQQLLEQERLLVPGNADGFMPGEAACAILLQQAHAGMRGVLIRGLGQGQEAGRPDGSVPSRAQGLSQAMREACRQAGIAPGALAFRISDQNGEEFFSREGANAITRLMFGAEQEPQHLTLAEKTGEIGAASGPAMLAWMSRDMARVEFSPGEWGMLHLANDDGLRCAVVLQYWGAQDNGNPRLRQR